MIPIKARGPGVDEFVPAGSPLPSAAAPNPDDALAGRPGDHRSAGAHLRRSRSHREGGELARDGFRIRHRLAGDSKFRLRSRRSIPISESSQLQSSGVRLISAKHWGRSKSTRSCAGAVVSFGDS